MQTECPSGFESLLHALCFSATVTSENTNMVDGLQNQLPMNAGSAYPVLGEAIVIYSGQHDD
jgi:hypothetical protein